MDLMVESAYDVKEKGLIIIILCNVIDSAALTWSYGEEQHPMERLYPISGSLIMCFHQMAETNFNKGIPRRLQTLALVPRNRMVKA